MENNFQHMFKIAWAEMPLSFDELKNIPYSHRTRPYLLCMDMGKYYYAFPCTSKVFSNKDRYENGRVIINNRKSLVRIERVYVLPKTNLVSRPMSISQIYSNEIIKKINACMKYSDYPEDFKEYFRNTKYYLEENDIIELGGLLYLIINSKDGILHTHRVYTYPVNGSVLVLIDGSKYYIDIANIYKLSEDDSLCYRTRINSYYFGIDSNIKDFLLREPVLKNQKDYSNICNLDSGMVIDTFIGKQAVRMIVLENNGSELKVLLGRDDLRYNEYQLAYISSDSISSYTIFSTLSDERITKFRDDYIGKELNKKKIINNYDII